MSPRFYSKAFSCLLESKTWSFKLAPPASWWEDGTHILWAGPQGANYITYADEGHFRRALSGVWIGGVWNHHFSKLEEYLSEAEICKENHCNSAERATFTDFRLRFEFWKFSGPEKKSCSIRYLHCRVFLNLWLAKPIVCKRVALSRNRRKSRKRGKQGVECWISWNHGNDGDDENHRNPGCKPRVPKYPTLPWARPDYIHNSKTIESVSVHPHRDYK